MTYFLAPMVWQQLWKGGGMPEVTPEDWARQNKMRQEWLANNPDADYIGWTSI